MLRAKGMCYSHPHAAELLRWRGNRITVEDKKAAKLVRGRRQKIVARLDNISQKVGAVKELQNQTEHEFSALESAVLSKALNG